MDMREIFSFFCATLRFTFIYLKRFRYTLASHTKEEEEEESELKFNERLKIIWMADG
jgi:hypothetical protein